MKTKIWVLSTCIPEDKGPARPYVFCTEALAESTADALIREEWEYRAPVDNDGGSEPWPGDWRQASTAMIEDGEGEYGGWELTSHEIDVHVPQAFRDLLALAKGLDAFQDDYRMNAALQACEAILEGRANG